MIFQIFMRYKISNLYFLKLRWKAYWPLAALVYTLIRQEILFLGIKSIRLSRKPFFDFNFFCLQSFSLIFVKNSKIFKMKFLILLILQAVQCAKRGKKGKHGKVDLDEARYGYK